MPFYDYKCCLCTTTREVVRSITSEEIRPMCPCCQCEMQRVFNNRGIMFREKGIFPYIDHNLGHEPVKISSRDQWKREMKQRGLRPYEPSSETLHRVKDHRRFY